MRMRDEEKAARREAMQQAAKTILTHHRAKECDDTCMSIKEIITLIPSDL